MKNYTPVPAADDSLLCRKLRDIHPNSRTYKSRVFHVAGFGKAAARRSVILETEKDRERLRPARCGHYNHRLGDPALHPSQ